MNRQRSTNHFVLLNNELKCYNCHNFGHKAANCHLKNYKADPKIKPLGRNANTWKNKDSEKCGLVISTQKQKDPWYLDSGCSKHMTGDKDKSMCISKSIRTDNNVDIESSLARKEGDSYTIKVC